MLTLFKDFIPPILLKGLIRIKNSKYGWKGDYSSWAVAKKDSIGYDSDVILNKVKVSLLKVKNGEAVYERDSVVFDEIQYSWQLLAGLMLVAAKNNGILSVLDFGGSLGSSYFQNRKFLVQLPRVTWSIVEQKKFVDCGKKEFESGQLYFYSDIESCVQVQNPNVLVLSSVLQYIEKPYHLLDDILRYKFEFIIIDITLFSEQNDRITLQKVHPKIYNASYPCWIFNKKEFINFFMKNNYIVLESFISNAGVIDAGVFNGFILKKNV